MNPVSLFIFLSFSFSLTVDPIQTLQFTERIFHKIVKNNFRFQAESYLFPEKVERLLEIYQEIVANHITNNEEYYGQQQQENNNTKNSSVRGKGKEKTPPARIVDQNNNNTSSSSDGSGGSSNNKNNSQDGSTYYQFKISPTLLEEEGREEWEAGLGEEENQDDLAEELMDDLDNPEFIELLLMNSKSSRPSIEQNNSFVDHESSSIVTGTSSSVYRKEKKRSRKNSNHEIHEEQQQHSAGKSVSPIFSVEDIFDDSSVSEKPKKKKKMKHKHSKENELNDSSSSRPEIPLVVIEDNSPGAKELVDLTNDSIPENYSSNKQKKKKKKKDKQ
jgi:hypothetical protein